MTNLPIPAAPTDLTPEWLTSALRTSGTLREANVVSLDWRRIGEGVGFMGQLAQITPQYDQVEEGAPSSLIGKFVAEFPENLEVAKGFRFYEVETRFYEEIAGDVELRTPRCYYSDFDPASGDFVLLLEDLAPARMGDQMANCSRERAELALRQLARFHAAWWQHPRLAELRWLPSASESFRVEFLSQTYDQAWGPFADHFGHTIAPEVMEIGERLGRNIPKFLERFSDDPCTIIHGDYRLDNLFFATPEGGAPFTVIDWQISARGRGTFDLAYFTAGTLEPMERKAKEHDILRAYHDTLIAHGVKDYSFEQCVEDYRASALFMLVYPVVGIGSLDMANERGVKLFTTILNRTAAAIVDLNAGEFLPS